MGLNTMYLNDINHDNDNFDDDDPEAIFLVRLMAWCNRYEQHKACRKRYKQRTNVYSMASNKMVGM